MRLTLSTITLWMLSIGAFAQFEVPVPYNPDGNADGFITLPDLLDFLALYGGEYSPEALATDSSSAIIHMGQGDYFDCASWCAGLEGNWKVMDEILVGRYKDEILTMSLGGEVWMDKRSNAGVGHQYAPTLATNDWSVFARTYPSQKECICQTRVIQPIVIQSGPCQGNVDLCGICDGPGPVYECGCFVIPEGACDCEGNQIDALGECGGNCLGDFDGDGICDSFAGGPCANEEAILYNGFNYELVEIGDQCWFVHDLRTATYTNGDTIAVATESDSEWDEFDDELIGAVGYPPAYEYNGAVYNWHAVLDSRGLCPNGWKVPSRSDYELLVQQVSTTTDGPFNNAQYENVNIALKDDQTWNGSNASGYKGTRTVIRSSNGSWSTASSTQLYNRGWTSTYSAPGQAYIFRLAPDLNLANSLDWFTSDQLNKGYGLSIRCIKDAD